MNVRGVDFVRIPVTDLARAARFYREDLGLTQEFFSEQYQWAEFTCGNITLALHGGEERGPSSGVRVALAVDDVNSACAKLQAKGVAVVEGPTDYSVCWSAEIQDPDGNAFLLHHRADHTWGMGHALSSDDIVHERLSHSC